MSSPQGRTASVHFSANGPQVTMTSSPDLSSAWSSTGHLTSGNTLPALSGLTSTCFLQLQEGRSLSPARPATLASITLQSPAARPTDPPASQAEPSTRTPPRPCPLPRSAGQYLGPRPRSRWSSGPQKPDSPLTTRSGLWHARLSAPGQCQPLETSAAMSVPALTASHSGHQPHGPLSS